MTIEEMKKQRRHHLQQAAELGKQIEKQETEMLTFKSKKLYTCVIDDETYVLTYSWCKAHEEVYTWTYFAGTYSRWKDSSTAKEAFEAVYDAGGTITEWDNPHDMLVYLAEQYKG